MPWRYRPFFTIGGHGDIGAGANSYSTFEFYSNTVPLDRNTLPGYWMEFNYYHRLAVRLLSSFRRMTPDWVWHRGYWVHWGLRIGASVRWGEHFGLHGAVQLELDGSGYHRYKLQACNSSSTTQGQVSLYTFHPGLHTNGNRRMSGAICVASLDTTATTGTLGLFTVVSQSVSSTTLTITFQAISGASGTVAADYHCLANRNGRSIAWNPVATSLGWPCGCYSPERAWPSCGLRAYERKRDQHHHGRVGAHHKRYDDCDGAV